MNLDLKVVLVMGISATEPGRNLFFRATTEIFSFQEMREDF